MIVLVMQDVLAASEAPRSHCMLTMKPRVSVTEDVRAHHRSHRNEAMDVRVAHPDLPPIGQRSFSASIESIKLHT